MSPSSREINGPRPAPLKIHKDSHQIQKSSSSSSSSTTTNHQQRHHPVIIYTHSPKVIHTQACDFMALVQKLTGLSRSTDDEEPEPALPPPPTAPPKDDGISASGKDSSGTHEPACSSKNGAAAEAQVLPPAANISPLEFDPPPPLPNHFLSEIPLFTPNSSDFFCPPRNFYRYPEPIANMGGSISPSFMEAMKAFPEF